MQNEIWRMSQNINSSTNASKITRVKASNVSENLLNKIRQIYGLYSE